MFSCNDKSPLCCAGDDDVFSFSIVNQNGLDLLNPTTQNNLNNDNIKIFEKVGSNYVEINDVNSDYPKGYQIIEDDLFYFIPLFKGDFGIIRWNNIDSDTIKLQSKQDGGINRLVKIWYNGELKWDEEDTNVSDMRRFQVTK